MSLPTEQLDWVGTFEGLPTYVVEVSAEDGDGYGPAHTVSWSISWDRAEKHAKEILAARKAPLRRRIPKGDWVLVEVKEVRLLMHGRYCHGDKPAILNARRYGDQGGQE